MPGQDETLPRSTAFIVAVRLPAVCELDHGTKNIFLSGLPPRSHASDFQHKKLAQPDPGSELAAGTQEIGNQLNTV